MKTCGSCFRLCEDWRDAESKGIHPIYHYDMLGYYRKPRLEVKLHAIGVNCPDDDVIHLHHSACGGHKYRLVRNMETWFVWHFKASICELWRNKIRVPLGGLRKPISILWVDYFDGMTDKIVPNGEPQCPRCGEMPYSSVQCVFCGQRFLPQEEEYHETNL